MPVVEPTDTIERGHLTRWRLARRSEGAAALARALRVPELVAHLLVRRGVGDPQAAGRFIRPSLTDLHDPALLHGAERAARRLVDAVRGHEPIVIYGDYDVDGVTATAIMFHMLKALDPEADVRRYVPHRIDEGYGLNGEAIASLCDAGARVIVSVDCGVTAVGPAAVAAERGADLIITDHHEPPHELPAAHTIVHPKLTAEGDGATEPYPCGDICGALVAYKLAWQIARCWCGSERVSETLRELLVDLLPLAALGTIADVVPLVDESRTVAVFGLRRIKRTRWVGLNALIDAARLRDEQIDSYHVGFVLGPRLNAVGRMGHAKEAIRLLTDAEPAAARQIAGSLEAVNEQRRATEREIFKQACEIIERDGHITDDRRAVVLADERWHPGVVGIVCSRLVERYGRPTVLLCIEGATASGSARSIDGFVLHEALEACGEHLEGFGGHAMAAGMRLSADRIDAFRNAMLDYAAGHLDIEDLVTAIDVDAEVEPADLTVTTVDQIGRLAPFGRGNPTPVILMRGVRVARPPQTLGREARHLAMFVEKADKTLRAIAWNKAGLIDRLPAGSLIDLVAEPKINRWRGRSNVELVMRDLRFDAAGDDAT